MTTTPRKKAWWRLSLTQQIVVGLVVGCLLGWLKPAWGLQTAFLRDIFLNLIKSLIAPLIFSNMVAGIAGGGDAKKIGRLGLKSILLFEAATTLALVIGLTMVNIVKPGRGVILPLTQGEALAQGHPATLVETIVHVFPANVVAAMANGDVLQIVVFAVIFGLAVGAVGPAARPVVSLCEAVAAIMFKFTDYIIKIAPIGVGAAMAVTIGKQGIGVLFNLGILVAALYAALIIFVVIMMGFSVYVLRVPARAFFEAVREPFMIAFATATSEPALPKAMENMEAMGVPRHIVGFVIPTGYSFNLTGSTLYLALASVFVAQAAETAGMAHFGLGQQLLMMLTLMITSKGIAQVPRASLLVLLATVQQFGLPVEGVALIFGVDAVMDMARTSVNVFGNCLASIMVAKWEGEYKPAA